MCVCVCVCVCTYAYSTECLTGRELMIAVLISLMRISGLNIDVDHILEMSCVVTDENLNSVSEVSLYFIVCDT